VQTQLDLQTQPQSQTQPELPIPDCPIDETLPEVVRVFRDMFRGSTTPLADSEELEDPTKVHNIGIVFI
jgi:hypothetical protein